MNRFSIEPNQSLTFGYVKHFDFKRHQSYQKSRKMIVRFVIYSVVIFLLLYLIMQQNNKKEATQNMQEVEIDEISIDD